MKILSKELKKSQLCLECMECCKILKIPHREFPTLSIRAFYEVRGCTILLERGIFYIIVPYFCPHLTPKGCDIYEDRPQDCKNYDGRDDSAVNCKWKELNNDTSDN